MSYEALDKIKKSLFIKQIKNSLFKEQIEVPSLFLKHSRSRSRYSSYRTGDQNSPRILRSFS
jgi:hypothetical protein